jgi:carbamoyltransferase
MTAVDGAPRYVLGVNPGFHDGSAALLRDSELVAMVEQERLSRNRRAMRESPSEAIEACLAQEGIDLGAIAEIAIGWDVPLIWEEVMGTSEGPFDEREFSAWLLGDAASGNSSLPPLRFVEHHVAHAASAFYTSGFAEAAILVVDGRGESAATSLAVGGPRGIEIVRSWGAHLSLGMLYTTAARWAGLGAWGEGKLMGLAAYGKPCQPVPLRKTSKCGYTIACAPPADLPPSLQLRKLRANLDSVFREHNYPFEEGDPADVMAFADFAASIQGGLEEALSSLAAMAQRETGEANLVLAGGVAMNCAANGRLIRSSLFEEVWIPPFPYDAGVSIGAAIAADRAIRGATNAPTRLPHAFWAPDAGGPDEEVLARLSDCDLDRLGDSELAETVAKHLEDGKLVGWHQGRAEVGQRALGARSILCDPRSRHSLVRTNGTKGREIWRPLAPAVTVDRAADVFDGPLPAAADFMLAAWPVRIQAQPRLPAAVHIDGSARPQVVHPQQQRYHDVIRAFHERTGVPAVINTSFNLAGEPIVLSPGDAVDTFVRSDLEVLVLNDLVACKPEAGFATSSSRWIPPSSSTQPQPSSSTSPRSSHSSAPT